MRCNEDFVDERECGGWFHIAVTATLIGLVSKGDGGGFEQRRKGEKKKRDGILRVKFAVCQKGWFQVPG